MSKVFWRVPTAPGDTAVAHNVWEREDTPCNPTADDPATVVGFQQIDDKDGELDGLAFIRWHDGLFLVQTIDLEYAP